MKRSLIVFMLIMTSLMVFLPLNLNAEGEKKEFDYNSNEFQEIVSMLYMQGHSEHDLTCPTKRAYYEEVAEMLEKGMNKEEIFDYYVSQYGEEALKAPYKKGFSLLAWVIPFIILIIAVIGVSFGIYQWVKSGKESRSLSLQAQETDSQNELFESVIDEERKKYL